MLGPHGGLPTEVSSLPAARHGKRHTENPYCTYRHPKGERKKEGTVSILYPSPPWEM